VFSSEKQHLRPVIQNLDIKNNYKSSISRSVHKDNTIRYLSNRYSLPLGTFNNHETVCINVTEDKQLIIYISDTGEIIANHHIPDGKGMLIKDRKHSRDRTKGIDAFMDTVAQQFENYKQAYDFLSEIRKKYPRYMRDQLQMILKETKENNRKIISATLQECVKRKLYGATDFSDVVSYVKRHRQGTDTLAIDNEEYIKPLNKTAQWILVIIDDLMFMAMDQHEANMFFHLINDLYNQTSIILTSNKAPKEWGELLGDQAITTAILDRILHRVEIIHLNEDSYRMKHRSTIFGQESVSN